MLAAAAIALAPASARADFHIDNGEVAQFVAGELLLPSETGAQVTSGGGRFVLGWSWQVPLGSDRHRVVAGVNLVPEGGPHDVGLRLGYRYADRNVLGGVGMAHDGAGFTWSLELGVRGKPLSFGLIPELLVPHVLVRGEISSALAYVRGGSLLVGWSF